jgi:hypothetical protein
VVLATGLRGKPRTLGVHGENLPKVTSLLEDPDLHRGQTVCVVGGGDSALEAAIALADSGAKVILTYRGKSFSRAQPKNRQTIDSYEAQRRIKVKYQSEVVAFAEDTVTLQMADGTQKRYPNQAAFVLIGADPPIEWLGTMGIHYVERRHMYALPPSDRMITRFLGDHAEACPETAAGAAALVFGQEVPAGLEKKRQVVAESRSKKWLRSASKVFTGGGKLERPMPLSEFAQQARRHSGQGRRDKLDPRERTRVLRMLRDEGGRRRTRFEDLHPRPQRAADRPARRGGSPGAGIAAAGAAARTASASAAAAPAAGGRDPAGRPAGFDDPVRTIPPTSRSGSCRAVSATPSPLPRRPSSSGWRARPSAGRAPGRVAARSRPGRGRPSSRSRPGRSARLSRAPCSSGWRPIGLPSAGVRRRSRCSTTRPWTTACRRTRPARCTWGRTTISRSAASRPATGRGRRSVRRGPTRCVTPRTRRGQSTSTGACPRSTGISTDSRIKDLRCRTVTDGKRSHRDTESGIIRA